MGGKAAFAWLAPIVVSIAGLVLTAAGRRGDITMAYWHLAIAALTALVLAALAIHSHRQLTRSGASYPARAAGTARSMGIVWGWGALALLATYGTGVLAWSEWWRFLIGFAAAAGLCFVLAHRLEAAARGEAPTERLAQIARTAVIAQLVGMVITMAGLLVDGKMTRFKVVRYGDWAGNHIFFFGALALAIISIYAIRTAPPAAGRTTP